MMRRCGGPRFSQRASVDWWTGKRRAKSDCVSPTFVRTAGIFCDVTMTDSYAPRIDACQCLVHSFLGTLHGMELDTIGRRLRCWRETHTNFVTASEAGRAINVATAIAVSTYLGHENDSRTPERETALRYAQFYRISVDWLLTGRGSPKGRTPVQQIFDDLPTEAQQEAIRYLEYLKTHHSD